MINRILFLLLLSLIILVQPSFARTNWSIRLGINLSPPYYSSYQPYNVSTYSYPQRSVYMDPNIGRWNRVMMDAEQLEYRGDYAGVAILYEEAVSIGSYLAQIGCDTYYYDTALNKLININRVYRRY